jgi:hypothetical protein
VAGALALPTVGTGVTEGSAITTVVAVGDSGRGVAVAVLVGLAGGRVAVAVRGGGGVGVAVRAGVVVGVGRTSAAETLLVGKPGAANEIAVGWISTTIGVGAGVPLLPVAPGTALLAVNTPSGGSSGTGVTVGPAVGEGRGVAVLGGGVPVAVATAVGVAVAVLTGVGVVDGRRVPSAASLPPTRSSIAVGLSDTLIAVAVLVGAAVAVGVATVGVLVPGVRVVDGPAVDVAPTAVGDAAWPVGTMDGTTVVATGVAVVVGVGAGKARLTSSDGLLTPPWAVYAYTTT